MGCLPGWFSGHGGRFLPRDRSLFFSLKFFIGYCYDAPFSPGSRYYSFRIRRLPGIILSFLVIPAGINLVSESEAAGSSRLATKIPSAAGFRIHGRKVPARNDTSNIHQGKEELENDTDWMVSSCRWKRNKKLTFQ